MDKINCIKENFITLISGLVFIIHFLFSPYPFNSIMKFRESFLYFFVSLKVKKYNVKKDNSGKNFRIISAGSNSIRLKYSLFIFAFKKYKFIGGDRGMYVVKIPLGDYKDMDIKCFDISGKKENADSLFNYLTNIKEDAILFFGIRDEATLNWNEKLDDLFKKMGSRFSLRGKYRYSYIFVVKKKGSEFFPVFEELSPDRIIFAEITL